MQQYTSDPSVTDHPCEERILTANLQSQRIFKPHIQSPEITTRACPITEMMKSHVIPNNNVSLRDLRCTTHY